jgi:hypothetical protein
LKNIKFTFDIAYYYVNYLIKQALGVILGQNKLSSGGVFPDQYQFIIAKLSHISLDFDKAYLGKGWNIVDFETVFPLGLVPS